jgi:hypothetical protein
VLDVDGGGRGALRECDGRREREESDLGFRVRGAEAFYTAESARVHRSRWLRMLLKRPNLLGWPGPCRAEDRHANQASLRADTGPTDRVVSCLAQRA